MKKLLLGILFALPMTLFAQVSTIQVTVSDTIEVLANHISVMISFENPEPTTEEDYSNPAPPKDFSAQRAEVVKLLDQNKISWKNAADQLGMFGALGRMGGSDLGLTADFTSLEQMNLVLPKIQAIEAVKTTETGTSVDKDKVDLTRLYEKLLKKSHAKAETLARLSGKKVGNVYQIGSAFDAFNAEKYMEAMSGGGSPYSGLMKMMGGMFGEKRADYKVPVSENLSVTYYLID